VSVGAGGIDWILHWQAMQAAAEAPWGAEAAAEDPWQHRAARFDRDCRPGAEVGLEQLRQGVLPTDVVADIGAGTGRHAVPMSRHCAGVIAVEPSPAMRARLESRVAAERASVSLVSAAWPCVIPAVDVAYSCHVVYGVLDIVGFLEQMTRAARRTCKLLLGLRAPAERVAPVWRAVHGVERAPRPAALEVLALLHQLGHAASLELVPDSEMPVTYLPTDEDLDELCRRLRLAPIESERARVRDALDAHYPRSSLDEPWSFGTAGTCAVLQWRGAA